MKGLTPEERQFMLECASGDYHDLLTDQEQVIFDRLHKRRLMQIDDNGEYVDSVSVTKLGYEVMDLDELSRHPPAWV